MLVFMRTNLRGLRVIVQCGMLLMLLSWQLSANAMSCLGMQGQPVDWWVVLKLPKSADPLKTGDSFLYVDDQMQQFTMFGQTRGINTADQPIAYTLNQIYTHSSAINTAGWLIYNDEPTVVSDNLDPQNSDYGHTKGAIGFDQNTGFWLISSVPKFPVQANEQYAYPSSGAEYGQSLLCVSVKSDQIPNIARQLHYTYPHIYSKNMPVAWQSSPNFSDLWQVMQYQNMQHDPKYSSQTILSAKGQTFTSIAKSYPQNSQLFYEYVAKFFQQPLEVETWIRGEAIGPVCNPYVVTDVESVAYLSYQWKESEDHSKWAVGTSSSHPLVCIGDLNRMVSQEARAGGTMCIRSPTLQKLFYPMVVSHDLCSE